jgi:hypothetical protein
MISWAGVVSGAEHTRLQHPWCPWLTRATPPAPRSASFPSQLLQALPLVLQNCNMHIQAVCSLLRASASVCTTVRQSSACCKVDVEAGHRLAGFCRWLPRHAGLVRTLSVRGD